MTPYFYTWTKQASMVPMAVQGAENDEFLLQDGRRVYDFISTSFQASFGHNNPTIIRSIAEQLPRMSIASPKATFPLKEQVSNDLIQMTGHSEGKMFYTVSGAEAVENAIKMARRMTGKPIILARKKSYHGASLGAMSVSGDWRSDEHLNFTEGTGRIPEPDIDPDAAGVREVVKKNGADQIAAIIVETISGTNGVIIPPVSWFAGLRKICDESGLILILDEVLAGFHRCHTPFAFQSFQARPDMICMSKAITGGYIPFGAVWVNQSISDFYNDRILVGGLTNYAHPLGLAAAAGVMEIIRQHRFLSDLNELELCFAAEIDTLAAEHSVSAVRRQGMLAAIEFGTRELPSWNTWVQRGLYLYTKGNQMILAPPLISTPKRLKAAFAVLKEVLVET